MQGLLESLKIANTHHVYAWKQYRFLKTVTLMIAISAQTRIACSDGKTLHSQNGQKPEKKTFAAAYFFQDDDNSRAFIFAK